MTLNTLDNASAFRHIGPGGGTSRWDCGLVVGGLRCSVDPTAHRIVSFTSGCRCGSCPECWQRWAHRATVSAVERVMRYYDEVGAALAAPRHYVLSPPASLYECPTAAVGVAQQVSIMQRFGEDVKRVMKQCRLTACLGIDHPYRMGGAAPDADAHGVSVGLKNRYTAALAGGDGFNRLLLSPHRHLLVFGSTPPSADFYAQSGGWVLRCLDSKAPRRLTRDEIEVMVGQRIFYMLTHSWVYCNSRVVRYYGGLSLYRFRRIVVDKIASPVVCPDCGAFMERFELDSYGIPIAREARYTKMFDVVRYERWAGGSRVSVGMALCHERAVQQPLDGYDYV